MKIQFTKMHGLGNDFMVIDQITQQVPLNAALIRRLGDRRTGVGFDQLLTLSPPERPDADFNYRIFNADGSEVEQCGNGARCIARFAVDAGLTPKSALVLHTNTGLVATYIEQDGQVRVELGVPSLDPGALPFVPDAQITEHCHTYRVCVETGPVEVVPVAVGNPHAVLFVEDIAAAPVETLGPLLQQNAAFPESVNVGFCQIVDENFVRLRVFERGVGETRACGSGACAAVVAGQATRRLHSRVKVSLPGGKVRVTWPDAQAPVSLLGPANTVFKGTLSV